MKWLPLFLGLLLAEPLLAETTADGGAGGDSTETKTLIWPDGTRYVGGVKDGKRWGKGTIFWEDGTRFVGNFRNDLREGPGTMILPDGTVYNGYFSNDRLVEAPAEPAAPSADIAETDTAPTPARPAAEAPATPAVAAAQSGSSPAAPQAAEAASNEAETLEVADAREIRPAEITEITDAVKTELMSMVDLWAAAWSEQNVPQYLAYYSEDFDVPGRQSRRAWEGLRRQRLSRPGFIDLDVTYERFEIVEPNVAAVTFNQVYRSDVYSDETVKTLTLAKEGPFWRILREETQ